MISLLQLQYFQQLARKQHLTKTAEELHISQSALSMMIRKMEEELGSSLFDRQDHQIMLNQFGEEYLRYVDTALSSLEQGKRRLVEMRESQTQKLSISVSHAQVWMDRILGFKRIHPGSYIALYAEDVQRFVEMICNYTVDFVLTGTTEIEDKRVSCTTISQNGIAVCVAQNHPLAERSGIYLHELEQEPFIDLSPGLPFRNFSDRLFAQTETKCKRIFEVDYDTRRRLVQTGEGYALTPNTMVTRRTYDKCAFIPLLDKCAVRSMGIFWKKGRQFSPIMRDFYQYIMKRVNSDIIEDNV